MKKFAKLLLLAVFLLLVCLSPLPNLSANHSDAQQVTWGGEIILSGTINQSQYAENKDLTSSTFITLLLAFLLLLRAVLPLMVKNLRFIRSFIHTLRLHELLYPVQYKTKYLASLPVIL